MRGIATLRPLGGNEKPNLLMASQSKCSRGCGCTRSARLTRIKYELRSQGGLNRQCCGCEICSGQKYAGATLCPKNRPRRPKESNCRCSWQGFFSLLRAQRAGASLPSEGVMRSTVKEGKSWVSRHTIVISGRKTSVNLEDEFWDGLKEVAVARNMKLHTLVTKIDSKRQHANLSSAVRLFVLDFYQAQIKLSAQRRR